MVGWRKICMRIWGNQHEMIWEKNIEKVKIIRLGYVGVDVWIFLLKLVSDVMIVR